jgi:hypothetical protein
LGLLKSRENEDGCIQVEKYEDGSADAIRIRKCNPGAANQFWKWDGNKFINSLSNQQYALSFEETVSRGDNISIRKIDNPNNADKINWKAVINPITPGVQSVPQDYFYIQSSKYPSTCVVATSGGPKGGSQDVKVKGNPCIGFRSFQWNFGRTYFPD